MQEAELIEHAEQLFASALVRAYQRDALIELYCELQQIWRTLVQPSDQRAYSIKLSSALQQVENACLENQRNRQLPAADLEIIKEIESQFAQLAELAKVP
jgi:hypothetical protein